MAKKTDFEKVVCNALTIALVDYIIKNGDVDLEDFYAYHGNVRWHYLTYRPTDSIEQPKTLTAYGVVMVTGKTWRFEMLTIESLRDLLGYLCDIENIN